MVTGQTEFEIGGEAKILLTIALLRSTRIVRRVLEI